MVADAWASAASTTRLAPLKVEEEAESGDGREEFEEMEVGEEGEEFEEDGEEARVARGRRAPRGPTQMERESHELTHLPYRAWCSHCVRGRGEKTPHRRRGGESEEEKRHMAPRMVSNDRFMSACNAEWKERRAGDEGRLDGKSLYEQSERRESKTWSGL